MVFYASYDQYNVVFSVLNAQHILFTLKQGSCYIHNWSCSQFLFGYVHNRGLELGVELDLGLHVCLGLGFGFRVTVRDLFNIVYPHHVVQSCI